MIFVTGATGQLGQEFKRLLNDQAIYLTRDQLDLSNNQSIDRFCSENKITYLVNAAAYTQVDLAEKEQELCFQINCSAPKVLSRWSQEKNFKLIHFSTDYVFNGKSSVPYLETDETDPINTYGKTKRDGEVAVLGENPNALVIRTSWVYSQYGKNFVKTIKQLGSEKDQLKIVNDQIGNLTWAKDIAKVAWSSKDLSGLYHYSSEGEASWYDIACFIKKQTGFRSELVGIPSQEYPTPAKRPHYTVLNKTKITKAIGLNNNHWKESLELCLKELS